MTDLGQPRRRPQADSSPVAAVHAPDLLTDHLADQAIDTVLTSLRKTQPSPGLQRRLLETLAAHKTTPATSWARRLLPRRTTLRALGPSQAGRAAGWLSLAATLVVTLSFAFLHQHRPAATATATANPTIVHSSVIASAPPTAAIPRSDTPGNLCCHSERSEEPPHLAANHGAQRRAPRPAATSSSTQLASFPAPPLPLTEQEKLLLRVARAQNPQQSPVLNPALRASVAARDDENFQVFFAPATFIKPYEPSN